MTFLSLALFWLAHRVPLPLVSAELLQIARLSPWLNLLVLNIRPLVFGFLAVELFSLLTSPGRRLRARGPAGRARLNRAALLTSLLLSAIQATGIARSLAALETPFGTPAVDASAWAFGLLTVAAVTAGIYVFANFLSEYGIGNGFGLLLAVEVCRSAWQAGRETLATDSWTLPSQGLGLLLVAVLAGLLVRLARRAEATGTAPFPQGILPVLWTGWLVRVLEPRVAQAISGLSLELVAPLLALVAVPTFSGITFHLFSSRSRLEANLPEDDEVVGLVADILRRRLPLAMALLTLGAGALLAWSRYQPQTLAAALDFLVIALVAMVALDVWDQFQFAQRHGVLARLAQLNDVHFADGLAVRLEEAGIDVLNRGYQLRALYFFFGPLFKIDVFVPREQLQPARGVLQALEHAREVETF